MKLRTSNFELLRILAMIFIVMGHFSGQASVPASPVVAQGSRIAVNLFLILGVWFLVDMEFSWKRVWRIYLEVVFYSIPLTLVMLFVRGYAAVGARDLIQGLIPFYGRALWYASAYISLVLFSPFLRKLLELPLDQLRKLVAVLAAVYIIPSTIPCFANGEYAADLSWFAVVYLIVGWIKREGLLERIRGKWWLLGSGVAGYLLIAFATNVQAAAGLANYWLWTIRSLPSFLIALLIFGFFAKLDIGSIGIVNWFAKGTFAVYIVHQVPAFRPFLWDVLCSAQSCLGSSYLMVTLYVVAVGVGLTGLISAFDYLRQRYLDPFALRK